MRSNRTRARRNCASCHSAQAALQAAAPLEAVQHVLEVAVQVGQPAKLDQYIAPGCVRTQPSRQLLRFLPADADHAVEPPGGIVPLSPLFAEERRPVAGIAPLLQVLVQPGSFVPERLDLPQPETDAQLPQLQEGLLAEDIGKGSRPGQVLPGLVEPAQTGPHYRGQEPDPAGQG